MKKLLSVTIMLFVVIALTGCFEDRIYLDFKAAEEIESLGPFERAYIYYSSFRNEWDIEVNARTLCGVVTLEINDNSLQSGFNELKTQLKCLEEKCKGD